MMQLEPLQLQMNFQPCLVFHRPIQLARHGQIWKTNVPQALNHAVAYSWHIPILSEAILNET